MTGSKHRIGDLWSLWALFYTAILLPATGVVVTLWGVLALHPWIYAPEHTLRGGLLVLMFVVYAWAHRFPQRYRQRLTSHPEEDSR